MTIYIENFLIQNILINFCLLKLVNITTKSKTSIFKLILASCVGAAFSVISAIFLTNNLILNFVKIICAFFMIFIAFKQTKKQFIFNIILLYIYTNAIFGIIVSANSASYTTSFGTIISSKFNLETICLVIITLTYIFEIVCKHIKYKLNVNKYIYKIKLSNNNTQIYLNAYLDTGNLLNYKNQPVVIVDNATFVKLANITTLDLFIKKFETIKTSTITNTQHLKAIKINNIKIENKNKVLNYNDIYIATDLNNSFKSTNYQALLSPQLF